MAPILVHGTIVPELDDSVSPMAANMVGSMMMRGLACPFTWDNMMVFDDDDDINCMIDRLPLAVSSWDSIIQKCHIAFCEFQRGNVPKSSCFISECFIPLLEVPGLETSCELTKTYRQGLKHVLDATSAFIRLHDAHEDMSRRNLFNFVASIPSVDSMDEKQKAAINAIRCKLSAYPNNKLYARAAIALDPNEGQWHFYLSKVIYDAEQLPDHNCMKEGHEAPDMADLLNHNKVALFSARKSPEPFLLMAHLILTYGHPSTPQVEKANECIKKALDQFPNSPFVHEQAAEIVVKSTPLIGLYVMSNLKKIELHYKEAIRLAGKDILSIRHRLGLNQVLGAGQLRVHHEALLLRAEGMENLSKARHLTAEARIHYELAKADNLNFSALSICSPFMFTFPDDDDDDYELVSCPGASSSKGNKKSKKGRRRRK
ncbi:uncharacterized protein LOC117652505 [Thrips palmi]|uniref:Uncharacterized protein LOC117652505 n=1 Tax=Thrips palmi TaxID=161013 RepID=A0A6P9A760_THRPL|nr:uncharacterized protein LOC117652505 [Thrips palmi]